MKVIVIGAGILGALTAYRLARSGADVTVIDARGPCNAASGASFGWINASFHLDEDHFHLRHAALDAHKRLAVDLTSDAADWPGCLCWEDEGAAFDKHHDRLSALGYAVRIVERPEFAMLEPAVQTPDRALFFAEEGAVDLDVLAADALRAAAELGARLVTGVVVSAITEARGRVQAVQTDLGAFPADRVVVAAGVATEALLQTAGVTVPMLHRPALILRSEPVPPLLTHVLVAPGQELRQTRDGTLLAPAAARHQSDDADRIDERPDLLADATMARVSRLLGRPLRWRQVTSAARPMPQDGRPVIGACGPEGLYVSTMHSGATLGPLVAEMVAAELMDMGLSNTQAALLAPYRPQRFTA